MVQLSLLFHTLGAKSEPNNHERLLLERARKYIGYLRWIPGVRLIAVCNSLSFFATHADSDIDLFIVTRRGSLWVVRTLVTLTFWTLGVWRHGKDIRENFCLSFFVTEDGMNLEKIAIEDDIYLRGWITRLMPILIVGESYERFLEANSWITLDPEQKRKNLEYSLNPVGEKKESILWNYLDTLLYKILFPKALKRYTRLGKPWGVIIDDTMLKFHDNDQRIVIRDQILKKNFDK